MVDSRLNCGICGETMNLSDRQPVALPGCGHTFCRFCLIRINSIYEEIKCPACRHLHTGVSPEELPPNYALMSVIEMNEISSVESRFSETSQVDYFLRREPHEASFNSSSRTTRKRDKALKVLKWVGIGTAAAVGGAAMVAAAPVVLTGIGFTSAGIGKGSIAASMMSSAALANGGGIATSSLVATLQSAGAAGIGTKATAVLGATGAGAGGGIAFGFSKLFRRFRRGHNSSGERSSRNCSDPDGGQDYGNHFENECISNDSERGQTSNRRPSKKKRCNDDKDGDDSDDSDNDKIVESYK